MALLKDFFQPYFEVTIVNCYWKIETDSGIQGGKTKIKARLSCYKNKTAADKDENKYGNFDFEFVPDLNSVNNFIAQAYLFAKTLPQFTNAIDA